VLASRGGIENYHPFITGFRGQMMLKRDTIIWKRLETVVISVFVTSFLHHFPNWSQCCGNYLVLELSHKKITKNSSKKTSLIFHENVRNVMKSSDKWGEIQWYGRMQNFNYPPYKNRRTCDCKRQRNLRNSYCRSKSQGGRKKKSKFELFARN